MWTEEPGGLQSMGSQRIRHDLVTEQQRSLGSHIRILPVVLTAKSHSSSPTELCFERHSNP